MIQQVERYNSVLPQQQKITISVEIEKTREPLYQLFPHGDVVRASVPERGEHKLPTLSDKMLLHVFCHVLQIHRSFMSLGVCQ